MLKSNLLEYMHLKKYMEKSIWIVELAVINDNHVCFKLNHVCFKLKSDRI